MSWTSEFEPPPPRPILGRDKSDEADFETEAAADIQDNNQVDEESDFDVVELEEDGALDPSVFDGLFADLGGDDDVLSDDDPSEAEDLEPIEESEPVEDLEPTEEFEEAKPAEEPELVEEPGPADDYEPVEEPEPTDHYEPVEEPEPTDHYEPGAEAVDPDDLVDASEELIYDVIQQHPGSTEPRLEHLDAEAAPQDLFSGNLSAAPSLPPEVHYDPTVTGSAPAITGEEVPASRGPASERVVDDEFGQREPVFPRRADPVVTGQSAPATSSRQAARVGPPAERRWPAFLTATIVGATLGIVGAMILFQVVRPSQNQPATETDAQTAATTAADTVTATETADGQPAGLSEAELGALAASDRLELNTVRFEPGTTQLTEASQAALAEAVNALSAQPSAPLTVEVRTFSESSPEANRSLSTQQGDALVSRLIELGAPTDSISVTTFGPAQFDEAHPVQNFVVPSAGLQPSGLRSAAEMVSPFAIGLDPTTNQLRSESILPLSRLAEAMVADTTSLLSLAAYSYAEPGAQSNQSLAAGAAGAASAFLTTNYDIDPGRISVLTPGQTPFVVGAEVGNHVQVHWGGRSQVVGQLNSLDLESVTFAPGSSDLSAQATAVLDQVVGVLAEGDATLVLSVHTATEQSDETNAQLSSLQSDALVAYLTAAGVPAERVRGHGRGNQGHFQGNGPQSAVIFTALP